jgi:hypothetical protein
MITIGKLALLILVHISISSHTVYLDIDHRIEFKDETELFLLKTNGEGNNRCPLYTMICSQSGIKWRIGIIHFCPLTFPSAFTIVGINQVRREWIELSRNEFYQTDISTCKFENDLKFLK